MDATIAAPEKRWELYKLLAEPVRLRLLALTNAEELAIGELAELLGEAQPNVSRHLKPLRAAGLVSVRKQGTRVFASLDSRFSTDPVIADALAAGRELCESDGSLGRIASIVGAREAASRDFFDQQPEDVVQGWPAELPAYLSALAPLIRERDLAIDVGTGHGSMLEVLAPIFKRVVGIDRSGKQLARARARLAQRGYANVELMEAELTDAALEPLHQRANAVFAARVLHHAPKPAAAMRALSELVAPGGALLVVDYVSHQDERMRDTQADVWLGFDSNELKTLAHDAGLVGATLNTIPAARCGAGPDGHLDWQVLAARRP